MAIVAAAAGGVKHLDVLIVCLRAIAYILCFSFHREFWRPPESEPGRGNGIGLSIKARERIASNHCKYSPPSPTPRVDIVTRVSRSPFVFRL